VSVLSADDHRFFAERGYLVVPDAVPRANLDAALDAIWWFLGVDRNHADDWYRPPVSKWGGVEMYQHQALWDNRQHPKVHAVFAELIGTEKLWVSTDRAAMKAPARPDKPEYDGQGFTHWDADLAKIADYDRPPASYGLQGVLALADTPHDAGGFRCVPGFHRELREWVPRQRGDKADWKPDASRLEAVPIPCRAGDLIIWTTLLPHGNGRNTSDVPRLAQYITMFRPPAEAEARETMRRERIHRWQNRLPNDGPAFPGDPRKWEQIHGKTAELTPLGRMLLGVDEWT
jgi:hypothetical protein